MPNTTTVSKRVRFEILRRDNHTCRYCGRAAPEVKLHVDHVMPVALGGTNSPDNLAAACADCNAGKSSTSPDSIHVDDVKASALRFKQDYTAALESQVVKIRASKKYRALFAEHWAETVGPEAPSDWPATLDHWNSLGVPWEVVENAVDIAASKPTLRTIQSVYKYTCGIVWNVIKSAAEEYGNTPGPIDEKPRACDVCEDEVDALLDEWDDDGGVTWRCFECHGQQSFDEGAEASSQVMWTTLRRAGGVMAPMDLLALFVDRRTNNYREDMEWSAA